MGTSANVTMTNLKSATGIADDRLSAHHPNGAGNQTKMGDFLVANLGGNLDPGTTNDIDGLQLIPVEVNGSQANADGSYNANDWWEFSNTTELQENDTIKIEVWFERGQSDHGDLARQQILTRQALWDVSKAAGTGTAFTLENITSYRAGSSYVTIVYEITIDDAANEFGIFTFFDAQLNTDMPNFGSNLSFRTKDISGNPYYVTIDSLVGDSDGAGITANYTVENGAPPYNAELILDGSGVQDTATHSSDGSYSMKDTDATTDQEHDFTITVTDDRGAIVSDSSTYRAISQ